MGAVPVRILVTGTRGKSSIVRLLHAGLAAAGLRVCSRVTGVLPRSLLPDGKVRIIHRTAPANFREMLWWLGQVPRDTDAIVMENSAVSPELQPAAGAWLNPGLVVWTTLRADHEDAWGPGRLNAAHALLRGIPRGAVVAAGQDVMSSLRAGFEALGCSLITPDPALNNLKFSFHEENLSLAAAALRYALRGRSVNLDASLSAMRALEPDVADFRIIREGGGDDMLASAFSANDVETTAQLLRATGWDPGSTTLLYHHRPDRVARLKSFLPWIGSVKWRGTAFTRTERPLFDFEFKRRRPGLKWLDDVRDPASFRKWLRGRGRVFACGNVAGWPLEFLLSVFCLPVLICLPFVISTFNFYLNGDILP